MLLFLGKNLRSGGVNCSPSFCYFAPSLDSRSIGGLLLSSSSRELFMASLFGDLQLNCSVEEFLMGVIFLLEDISLRIFRTSSFSYFFISHLFATPISCMFIPKAEITKSGKFLSPLLIGMKSPWKYCYGIDVIFFQFWSKVFYLLSNCCQFCFGLCFMGWKSRRYF